MSAPTEAAEIMAKCRELTAILNARRGTTFGIACKQGLFSVTETTKEGRKYRTEHLTGWQSYRECVAHMEGMIA